MDKTLLDTDIFSEIFKGKHAKVIAKAHEYYAQFGQYTISIITVVEVTKGFYKVQRHAQLQRFLETISDAEILTLKMASAELAGRIYADLENQGTPLGCADPMIAAIALTENLILTTGNLRHYQYIQELGYPLKLDNWKS